MARALAILGVIACSPAAAPPQPHPHPTQPRAVHVDPQLVRTLAVLATRKEPTASELAATSRELDAGTLAMPAYIDRLVASDAFASDVAPVVILRYLLSMEATATPSMMVLEHTTDATPRYYFGKPCAPKAALRVKPWWDIDHEVAICPDAYRPAQWMAQNTRAGAATDCLSIDGAYGDGAHCGCGPNLVRCFPDGDERMTYVASMRAELRDTVGYIVAHDLPAESIFTSTASFRGRKAEAIARIEAVEARRDVDATKAFADLATWPAAGRWAPREELAPGQHAGVLTSPMLLYNLPDRRQRMSILYEPLWCMEPDSAGATPQMLL
jgi:hypothetical protein